MRVKSIRLQNFRSFVDSEHIHFEGINVLIGANNSGKSSILRGLHQLQHGIADSFADVRVGTRSARIEIELIDAHLNATWGVTDQICPCIYTMVLNSDDRRSGSIGGGLKIQDRNLPGDRRLPNMEPDHFIIPYLSKRKAVAYVEDIRESQVFAITPDVSNLAAKLSRLANPAFPAYEAYADACKEILGFIVTAIPAQNGQRPGVYLPNGQTVPIDQMGEGVPNIVHLLASLATSTNKLFLIEEPENDLHPTALRALLDLIIKSSLQNQFVVSTHSNIVMRHLCAAPKSALFKVSSQFGVLPQKSFVELVPATPQARMAVLRELGYEFSDLDLWDGWLILEESSAERIIRDYLIPWFAPKLSRVRTISAAGVDRVAAVLDDFMRLIVFTHLQPVYTDRTWVRVDGDAPGLAMVKRLREKMNLWPDSRIMAFDSEQFELNYPLVFAEEIQVVLAVVDGNTRRTAKRELLNRVMLWLDEDVERGRIALAESAVSVIADLKLIESQI